MGLVVDFLRFECLLLLFVVIGYFGEFIQLLRSVNWRWYNFIPSSFYMNF